ncbi:MAG: hypothetical protein Q8S84_04630 [bacterium]|nr:hypothetical protein [bacterium]
MSHTLFHTLALAIQAYNAFLFASIILAHFGFLLFHQIIIDIAESVFIPYFLSFIQKSNVTKSQSLNTIDSLGNQ